MRVLILSCNTGEGHNSCGKAIQEAFHARNIDCEMEDALRFVSPKFSKVMSWGHTKMYRYAPKLFRSGYQYAEVHTGIFEEQSSIYKMLTSGTEQLHQFIQAEGYDTIICPHVFSALMVTDVLRQYHIKLHTCFVATDYTCSPSCGESKLDAYFIPDSTLMDEFASCGVPREKMIASGIPVRKEFFTRGDKAAARQQIGLRSDCRHLLIMSGSMGCGPIRKLVKLLGDRLSADCHISVICGTNCRLKKRLEQDHADQARIHMYGFRKDISMMMDSADLYLTKPGGISTSEAARKKLPMVFVNAVAGCETYNLRFFVEQGAAATADTPEELAELTLSLLLDSEKLNKMSASFRSADTRSPAEVICDYFWEQHFAKARKE